MSKPDQQELPITVIVCRRGVRRKAAPCSIHSCTKPHTRLCDFRLTGRKEGKTCDAKLCDDCAMPAGPGLDYCPPHTRFVERQGS